MTTKLATFIIKVRGTAGPTPTMSYTGLMPGALGAAETPRAGGAVVKHHSRPSAQYRYEHYDPAFSG
jgi:hypothetical protein